MARQRTIVGIGEALLAEYPDREEPAGLAIETAIWATRLGQRGIPISRLGQDALAAEVVKELAKLEVDCSHLQSDPDLPTARLVVRSIGGRTTQDLDPHAAFDNLQWDFDLQDVAQQADAVLFGALARRSSQTRSVIEQMLGESRAALRVLDLTNRNGDEVDRDLISVASRYAESVVLDAEALHAMLPARQDQPVSETIADLLRQCDLKFIVSMEPERPMAVHTPEEVVEGKSIIGDGVREAAVVALVHAVLRGASFASCIAFAESVATHVAAHRHQPLPAELQEPKSE